MRARPVLVLSADDLARRPFGFAARDIVGGLRLVELWGTMAWLDLRQRYSRSVIGPFWLTLSLAVTIAALATVFGPIFKVPLREFLPHLALGMVVWSLVAATISEGVLTFVNAGPAIKQMRAPLSIHAYRVVARGLLFFAHNFVAALAVLLVTDPLSVATGLVPSLLGLAIVAVNCFAAAVALGTIGARFRDLSHLSTNIVAILFIVSPILWMPSQLGANHWAALLNPVFHFIEIVRAPLLGQSVSGTSWLLVAAWTLADLGLAFLIYARFRLRLPYWV